MIVVIRRIFVVDAVIGKNLLKSTCSTTQADSTSSADSDVTPISASASR